MNIPSKTRKSLKKQTELLRVLTRDLKAAGTKNQVKTCERLCLVTGEILQVVKEHYLPAQ